MGKILKKQRLSFEDRRSQILGAAVPMFASQGFKGLTTKELAKRAGVSEALLYQHYPSKEALYEAVQDYFCERSPELRAMLQGLTPSSETLVVLFYVLSLLVIAPPKGLEDGSVVFPRLLLHSLLDDGVFARLHRDRRMGPVSELVHQSLAAARACGDLGDDDCMPDDLRFSFAHHVLIMVRINQMPTPPLIDYPPPQDLLDHQMRFCLRGMGFTPAAIRKYYRPEALFTQVSAWLKPPPSSEHL